MDCWAARRQDVVTGGICARGDEELSHTPVAANASVFALVLCYSRTIADAAGRNIRS
jgi:hypothetical protein